MPGAQAVQAGGQLRQRLQHCHVVSSDCAGHAVTSDSVDSAAVLDGGYHNHCTVYSVEVQQFTFIKILLLSSSVLQGWFWPIDLCTVHTVHYKSQNKILIQSF